MMKNKILLIAIFLLTVTLTYSEEKTEEWPKNRIGMSASTFTGYGLTYYRHFNDDFALKLAVFGYGENQSTSNNYTNLFGTFGTQLEYNLNRTRYTRLHIFAALSIWYDESTNNNNPTYHFSNIERTYVTGIGFGFEFLAWGIISFNIETGLMGRFGVNTYQDNSPGYQNGSTSYPKYYGFGIGGGLSYAF